MNMLNVAEHKKKPTERHTGLLAVNWQWERTLLAILLAGLALLFKKSCIYGHHVSPVCVLQIGLVYERERDVVRQIV